MLADELTSFGCIPSYLTCHISPLGVMQGFMQDQIIASHTCFGGHMLTIIKPVYKVKNVSAVLKWTINIHVIQFTLTSKA